MTIDAFDCFILFFGACYSVFGVFAVHLGYKNDERYKEIQKMLEIRIGKGGGK